MSVRCFLRFLSLLCVFSSGLAYHIILPLPSLASYPVIYEFSFPAPPNATDCGHKGFEKPRSRDIPKQLADNITRAFQNRSLLVKVREGVIASYGSPDEKGRRMITIDLDLNSQLPAVGIAFTQSRTTTVLWFIMDDYDFTWSNDPEAIKKLCEELPAICELVREDNSVIIALRKKNEPARSIPMGSNPGRFIDDGTGIVDAYNAALKEQELAIFRVMASGESFRVRRAYDYFKQLEELRSVSVEAAIQTASYWQYAS